MSDPQVSVFPDTDAVARAVAGEFVLRLLGIQARRGRVSAVLTGGGIGTAMLTAVADDPDAPRVDWSRVALWWGDERYLPDGDAERNETGAREALSRWRSADGGGLDPAEVHPMPSSDGPSGGDVQRAVTEYAAELAAASDIDPGTVDGLPALDVVLLGIGPEGHVASLFPPGTTGGRVEDPTPGVIAVTDSPKPPPVRTTLTIGALNSADEVWLLATGDAKAEAVATALRDPGATPAGQVTGRRVTRWWLDEAAATKL
jgi:6-phosphogluconolactonase